MFKGLLRTSSATPDAVELCRRFPVRARLVRTFAKYRDSAGERHGEQAGEKTLWLCKYLSKHVLRAVQGVWIGARCKHLAKTSVQDVKVGISHESRKVLFLVFVAASAPGVGLNVSA